MLGGCAAAPWSCAAPWLPAAADEGSCVASCKRVVDVHHTCLGLQLASTDGVPGWVVVTERVGRSSDAPRGPGVAWRRGLLRRSMKASV